MVSLPSIDPIDELICLGHEEDLAAQDGALAPPVVQTSLFAHPSHSSLMRGLATEHQSRVYTRGQNPTVEALEEKLARLERGEACKCFSSGMAAISAVMQSELEAGDHVLFVNHTYGPTLQLAEQLAKFGVEHDITRELDPDGVLSSLRSNTRLVWMESPGTMLFRTLDVRAVVRGCSERGVITVLDNSWASPLFQKPLELGVDLVVHSATKYIGGHSDVVAGAVVGSAEVIERIFYRGFLLGGGALAPWDAFLLNRGLRTLPVRLRTHHASALRIARWLDSHPQVGRVHSPGLAAEESVRRGLRGFSGLLSFELSEAEPARLAALVDRLELFRIGVSWGGVESLVFCPNRGDNEDALAASGLPAGLIRLSIGLEPVDELIADLDRSLTAVGA